MKKVISSVVGRFLGIKPAQSDDESIGEVGQDRDDQDRQSYQDDEMLPEELVGVGEGHATMTPLADSKGDSLLSAEPNAEGFYWIKLPDGGEVEVRELPSGKWESRARYKGETFHAESDDTKRQAELSALLWLSAQRG